jgi:hypothetical protein
MSTSDSPDGPDQPTPDPDLDLPARRADQARMTRDALTNDGSRIRIYPDDDPAQMAYMYQDAVLLVRTADLETVENRLLDVRGGRDWETREDQPIPGVVTLLLPEATDLEAVCDDLDAFARPGIAMPEHVVHITPAGCCPATEPNPVLGQADLVPPLSTDPVATGAGVRVVVIDTGRRPDVERDHPELLSGITGAGEGPAVGHYSGHGTFVCGVLRTQAPECAVDVNAVTVQLGSVVETSLVSTLFEALKRDQPHLVSMSAGTTTRKGFSHIALEALCAALGEAGILLVAAAGNEGTTERFYPAAFNQTMPHVVAVGALDGNERLADYSNRDWPTVYARGSEVVNAFPRGEYVYQEGRRMGLATDFPDGVVSWSGTSFATPIVAGLIAARASRPGKDVPTAWAELKQVAGQGVIAGLPVLRPGDA